MRAKMRELHYPGFGKCWAVSFSFDREVVAKLKARFPAKKRLWDPRVKAWFVQTEHGNLMNFFVALGYEARTVGLDHLFPEWPRVGNFTVQGPPPATADWDGHKGSAKAQATYPDGYDAENFGSLFGSFFEKFTFVPDPPPPSKPAEDPELFRRAEVSRADYHALHLLESAPWCVVRAAYKALALEVHPDRGGSEEESKKVTVAYQRIYRAMKAGAA